MSDECANPLLLKWLEEWMEQARERGSKGFTVYKKAYQSVKACPLRFDHPSEAQQLNGLGPKLCDRLTEKLQKHCAENGLPMPSKTKAQAKRHSGTDSVDVEAGSELPSKKQRRAKPYVPQLRSGAYALIMALGNLDQSSSQSLSKADLIEKAQPFCDASFSAPSDPTKFFTAWASMKTLEAKELVCTRGHPTKKYYLSDEGWEVALRMKATINGATARSTSEKEPFSQVPQSTGAEIPDSCRLEATQGVQTLGISPSPEPEDDTSKSYSAAVDIRDSAYDDNAEDILDGSALAVDPIVLPAGSFEVCMVLDTREVRTKSDRDYLANELRKQGVSPEIRALPLADVLWIAKVNPLYAESLKRSNAGDEEEGSTEVVLEHALERKRLDDLIGSIKDGRFHEQKFRLKKSGLRYITYLIEDYSISAEKSEKYGEAVQSAIASMQVVNDIFVKQTSKIDHTIRYLAHMTTMLKVAYEKKELYVIPSRYLDVATHSASLEKRRATAPEKAFSVTFSAFCALCDKSDSMTLRDVYLKMLMCTRGVTGDKAIEIQRIWGTPQALIEAYDSLGSDAKKRDSMISDRLGNVIPRKKVARALSAKIAEVWAGKV